MYRRRMHDGSSDMSLFSDTRSRKSLGGDSLDPPQAWPNHIFPSQGSQGPGHERCSLRAGIISAARGRPPPLAACIPRGLSN